MPPYTTTSLTAFRIWPVDRITVPPLVVCSDGGHAPRLPILEADMHRLLLSILYLVNWKYDKATFLRSFLL